MLVKVHGECSPLYLDDAESRPKWDKVVHKHSQLDVQDHDSGAKS